MQWNPEQTQLIKELIEFCRDPHRTVFQVRGRAGTGKTTLVQEVRDRCDELSFIALAYTGKAASRLRRKGWHNAATIHSKLYLPGMQSRARLRAWVMELELLSGKLQQDEELVGSHQELRAEQSELRTKIAQEEEAQKSPSFIYNQETTLKDYDVVVVDEVSMLGHQNGSDLDRARADGGFKLILLGDDNQLPPVKQQPYYMNQKPDFMLTQIMRQEKDNPIIWLADYVLEHRRCAPLGSYGTSSVIQTLDPQICIEADQMIVGKNESRIYYNKRLRELRGYTDLVEIGEKLICLANDAKQGYFNGTMWYVQEVYGYNSAGDQLEVRLSSDDDNEEDRDARIWVESLKGNDIPWMDRQGAQCMVSAQAVTVHKFQGSEAKKIAILDESRCSGRDHWRWLYTAITRAQAEACIALDG